MANQRKRRKWRLVTDESGNLRDWAESSDDLTAIATRAQLPNANGMPASGASSTGVLHGGTERGERSEDASTIGAASGERSGKPSTDSKRHSGQTTQARKELGALKALDVIAFNRQAEVAFVSLLTRLISDGGGEVLLIDAIRETAFALDISTETAKRYLLKHTASAAEFVSDGKVVRLRNA